ncbi:transcription repressor OFP7-like [Musa acuminata AAA Group]|uniref:transcription repressor OFP7-like n=1 Tax=Musa acuminata AAA Group TaxID=214697 RepID=UPI0031DB3617
MAKRLRLCLSRVLPSFHAFRSKDNGAASSSLNSDDGFDVDFHDHQPPLPLPLPLPRRPHPPLVSASCCRPSRRRSRPARESVSDVHRPAPLPPRETPAYLWRKEEKWWHVVPCVSAHVYGNVPLLPSPEDRLRRRWRDDPNDGRAAATGRRKKVASRRRALLRRRARGRSYSSADDDSGWFSSDEETETLMSTTDVEPSDTVLRRRRRCRRKSVIRGDGRSSWPSPEGAAAVKRLIPCAAPAVRESFAVVKLSEDPREDFLRSMAEMVVEKEIFDADGLEQLLRCFLSLNSRQHHPAIVTAFEEIWDSLFPAVAAGTNAARRRSSPHSTL